MTARREDLTPVFQLFLDHAVKGINRTVADRDREQLLVELIEAVTVTCSRLARIHDTDSGMHREIATGIAGLVNQVDRRAHAARCTHCLSLCPDNHVAPSVFLHLPETCEKCRTFAQVFGHPKAAVPT